MRLKISVFCNWLKLRYRSSALSESYERIVTCESNGEIHWRRLSWVNIAISQACNPPARSGARMDGLHAWPKVRRLLTEHLQTTLRIVFIETFKVSRQLEPRIGEYQSVCAIRLVLLHHHPITLKAIKRCFRGRSILNDHSSCAQVIRATPNFPVVFFPTLLLFIRRKHILEIQKIRERPTFNN